MLSGANGPVGPTIVETRPSERVERFATQALLVERFSALSRIPVLSTERGAGTFFREFREYMSPENKAELSDLIAVPADPTDFLAFPCAADELRLALLMGGNASNLAEDLERLTAAYGLGRSLLNQPVRTLSGGERALVALAKAEALEPCYQGIVLASPVTWLHESRRHLVLRLCELFEARGKSSKILLLDGDWPEVDDTVHSYESTTDGGRVSWRLGLNDLVIRYPASTFPSVTEERTIKYTHVPQMLELVSPTLIRGENGIGKSSLALVLANVLQPHEGQLNLRTGGFAGAARLLLQDTQRQMFGMSSADHVHAVYRYDEEKRKSADSALEAMDADLRQALSEFEDAIATLDESGRPSSLLHDKLALAIERLVPRPNLLILDEPSWGLSDVLARELVRLIVREAHKRDVPIAIISHETRWLEHLYNSCLELRTLEDGRVEVTARVL